MCQEGLHTWREKNNQPRIDRLAVASATLKEEVATLEVNSRHLEAQTQASACGGPCPFGPPPVLRIPPDRADLLVQELEAFCGVAAFARHCRKLYGRLQFATTQAFGKVGRSSLRALSHRQHHLGGRTSIRSW